MTDFKLPGCSVSFHVHKGDCSEELWQPEPRKRLVAGSMMPLTFEWIDPDDWLARASERLAGLLYKIGIHWSKRWGQWRLVILEAEGEVIRDDEAGLEWRVTPGEKTQSSRGTFAEMVRLTDDRP